MDIKSIPVGNRGSIFTFPALPEQIKGKSAMKYQSFDIISQGTVKVPKGTDVTEISWDAEFFGRTKKEEAIVRKNEWKEPIECVNIIYDFIKNGAVLNLIVTETWINMDVTISSFQPCVYGAYGNIKYTISFVEKKVLEIYDTNDLKVGLSVKKTNPRSDLNDVAGSIYIVKSGDTLWGIASMKLEAGTKWVNIYEANKETIEAAARDHGKSSSDHGHWIWPGTALIIPV